MVNDSINLVSFYKALKRGGWPRRNSVVDAACFWMRGVLLTSLTMIGGLTPLMFETSVQAQFLIPMAVAIAFGLAFETLLVLLLLPALQTLLETVARRWVNSVAQLSPASG